MKRKVAMAMVAAMAVGSLAVPVLSLIHIFVEGKRRAELLGLEQETPYLRAETVLVNEEEEELPQAMLEAMYRSIRELFQTYCAKGGKLSLIHIYNYMSAEEALAYGLIDGVVTHK